MHFNEREYGTLVAALTFWGQAKKRPDHLLNLASAAGEMNALNSEEIRSLIEKINAIEAPDDIQESIDDDLHKELVDSAVPLGGNIGAMIEKSVQRILESGGIFILDDDDDAHGEIEASYSAYLQSFLWSVGFDAFENWRFVGPKTIRSAFSAALMKLETTFQGDDGSEDEETSVASSPTIPDMELAKRIANVITQATELKQDVIQKVDEHLYI